MEQIKEELWDIMGEVHRLANFAVGTKIDWRELDNLYWKLANLAVKADDLEETPQVVSLLMSRQIERVRQ